MARSLDGAALSDLVTRHAEPSDHTRVTAVLDGWWEDGDMVEDEFGGREFDGLGLFVDTTEGGAEAVFDDLVVTELVPR